MPKLVRFYIRHCLIGFAISAVFVALLLVLDVRNLRHLDLNDEAAVLVLFILWIFNGVVFASVQFAYAIMQLGRREDGGSGGTRFRLPMLAPVRAEAKAHRRR
jgi:uncharacterized membrane protein YedE/YeeE